jgi:hypothetical protein
MKNSPLPNESPRKKAIRYWERRRIFYNLALVPPAVVGYALADTLNWAGDPHTAHYGFALFWFALSALGANVCYSFAYALEFFFGSAHGAPRWRTTVFVGGVLFGMLLALIGGRNIADMEYDQPFRTSANNSLHSTPR